MGMMLVAGFVALAAMIAARLSHRAPTPDAVFVASPVSLPKGAKIELMSTGPDRIVLNILLSNGARQLLVLDIRTGRLIGTIPLQEE
jgi:hypothetical protein